MGKRRDKRKARKAGPAARGDVVQTLLSERADGRAESEPRPVRGWLISKKPVLGFVLLFAILMGLFYAVTFIPYVNKTAFPAYMRFNAQASAVILNVFGEGSNTNGTVVASPRFRVDIRHGCDAIEPSALFIAAVLAFPASLGSKLPGLLIGTLVLAVINLVRIVTLFYTGIYFPRAFEAVHVDVWQPIFILLSLTFWVVWAWWATAGKAPQAHDSAKTS